MSPQPPEPEPSVRLRLETTGAGSLTLIPGQTSAELDAYLEEQGADTLVFLPLYAPKKVWKKPARMKLGRHLEKRRKRLGKGEWGEGQLERADDGAKPVPAAWQLDARRYRARMVGEELGLKEFYWACRGGPLEVHQAELFNDDDTFELESVRVLSREGLRNMGQTAVRLDRLPEAAAAVGSNMQRFTRAAVLVIGISVVACGLLLLGLLTPDEASSEGLRRTMRGLGVLLHPVLVPALVLGAYMRRHLGLRSSEQTDVRRRELSRAETSRAWNDSAPHLLAVWLLIGFSVVVLTVGHLAATGELHPVHAVDKATTHCLVALWVLTPLTYARDFPSALGSCLEAAFTVTIAVFVLKLTMVVANVATRLLWAAIGWVTPFTIPDWIRVPLDALTSISAELFFFVLILGYTWTKTREHFGRWATIRLNQPEAP